MTWTWMGIAAVGIIFAACIVGYHRGFVKEVVSTFFIILSFILVWLINPYINEFLRESTPLYGKIQESCQDFVQSEAENENGMGEAEQAELVERMKLPELLKNSIIENNTAEVYRYLAVNTFADYVSDSIALMVINGLSFLLSFLAATILIRTVTFALDILSKLPVINGANKITGALVGGIKCVVFIWIGLLVLTLMCNTEIGRKGMELIQEDFFLNLLYNQNIFVKVFMSIFYGS